LATYSNKLDIKEEYALLSEKMKKKQQTIQNSVLHVMSVDDLLFTLMKISAIVFFFSILILLQIAGVLR